MKLNDYKAILTEGEGYKVLPGFIPRDLIASFNTRLKDLYPVRAASNDKSYAEKSDIQKLTNVAVWWSQLLHDMPESQAIRKLIDPIITAHFGNMVMYANDSVTISAGSTFVNPHVDTPHRFKKFNYDTRLLGIQCIVALDHLNKDSASTGLVPYSQKRDFDIEKCYDGSYDRWFRENCIQPDMPRGSLLFYNARILHSSMPNPKSMERPALLFNYLDRSIVDEIKAIDNIWVSNG
jgi:ectoine hydroxylase-related dioxygenase (phytanoyl-CoA dioxygenase family)